MVFLEIPPNCIRGRERSPSSDQLHAFDRQCKSIPEYSNLCIRLNSSKIHSSNNNVTACAAPFIPLHSSQLQIWHTYQLPQPCIQYPLSFEYSSSCTLNMCVFLFYNNNLWIQGSDPFDPVDPSDLLPTSMVVSLFNLIIILHVATMWYHSPFLSLCIKRSCKLLSYLPNLN